MRKRSEVILFGLLACVTCGLAGDVSLNWSLVYNSEDGREAENGWFVHSTEDRVSEEGGKEPEAFILLQC